MKKISIVLSILVLSFFISVTTVIADDDLEYMIEDFEDNFVSVTDFGSIPSGWSVSGPQEVVFSKGIDSHNGQSGLSAEATYHPSNYTVLEATLLGQPGAVINLQIQAKAATSGTGTAVLDASYDTIIDNTTIHHFHKITNYWYDYSSTDWRSITLENIEVPSSGELPVLIGVAHTTSGGSTDFDFDSLTSNESLVIDGAATVTGTLTLPAEANGKEYIVIVDNDTEGDNGWINATVGTCGSGTTVDYSITDVLAGTYYVYAVVRNVSAHDSPAEYGDYIGFYGTGINPPTNANAVIPSSGSVILDIILSLWSDGVDDDDIGDGGGGGGGCFVSILN